MSVPESPRNLPLLSPSPKNINQRIRYLNRIEQLCESFSKFPLIEKPKPGHKKSKSTSNELNETSPKLSLAVKLLEKRLK